MLGSRVWAIDEGYIPGESVSSAPELVSHETACILNAGDRPATIEITIYFERSRSTLLDREPAGPYTVTVGPRRTLHLRFNDLADPKRVPRDTSYSSIIRSDVPVVVQHTRLDRIWSAGERARWAAGLQCKWAYIGREAGT